jgi:hypothetical protein
LIPTDSSGTITWLAARLAVVLALNSLDGIVGVDGSPASDSALMFSLLVAGWLGGVVSATFVGYAV